MGSNMDDNLEEIIKIAWKAAPGNTDYYLTRYISQTVTQLGKTRDAMNDYEEEHLDFEVESYYLGLAQKEKSLEKKIDRLNRLVSFLRGS